MNRLQLIPGKEADGWCPFRLANSSVQHHDRGHGEVDLARAVAGVLGQSRAAGVDAQDAVGQVSGEARVAGVSDRAVRDGS